MNGSRLTPQAPLQLGTTRDSPLPGRSLLLPAPDSLLPDYNPVLSGHGPLPGHDLYIRFAARGGPISIRPGGPPTEPTSTATAGTRGIVGRDRELAAGDAFLDRATEGQTVLFLDGEAGIGKTTVWQEIIRRAESRGFDVLISRPVEAETKVSLAALGDLLQIVPAEAYEAMPDPQRHALEVALLRIEPGDARVQPRTLGAACRTLFAQLSAGTQLLIAIDDVQWLDTTSATVLAFALRRLAGARIGWLLARRDGDIGPFAADQLVGQDSITQLPIGPLTVAALHHALKDRLARAITRPLLVRLHEASGGNPFYALEMARAFDEGMPVDPLSRLPVAKSLRDLLARRIPKLRADARQSLLAAAALAHPTTEIVERASSRAGLAAAEQTGLIRIDRDRVTFVHPLYASAAYSAAALTERRRLHQALAGLVTDPQEQARHLAIATTEPDDGIARTLEHAAAMARSRGAWDSAAELFEQAYLLTPSDRVAKGHRRAVQAAEHHVHGGDRPRARALLERLLRERLPRPIRAEALRLLAEISYNDENFGAARTLFTEALELVDGPPVAVAIELGLGYVHSSLWDFPAAAEHAHRALEGTEGLTDGPLTAEALALCAMMDYLCGRGVDWEKVERSIELEDPDRVVALFRRPSTITALLPLYVGRHSEARDRLAAVVATARERGDESDLAFILLWLSWLETRCANFEAAAALADEAASLATLTGSQSMHGWVLAQQAFVMAHRGDIVAARSMCADAAVLADRFGVVLARIWVAASLALLELSLGHPDAAWRACELMTEALEGQGIAEPVVPFFLPDALEALVALGQLDRAEALLVAFEGRARELDRAWALATGARCRGLLLAARGDLDGAVAALDHAVLEHARLDMPFEGARTLLARGVIERRARLRTRAKGSLQEAAEAFERMGARLWAGRARGELERVGLRRSSGEGLTDTERRVAELAASGLTNRQVAAALFISPKTVEANLARAYRKLGIGSRAELGSRMRENLQT